MRLARVKSGDEWMYMHENGRLERVDSQGRTFVHPTDSWRITSAVMLNNFGRVTRRFSLDEILAGSIPWNYKNGKQRVHIQDFDHGMMRCWMSPGHEVRVIPAFERSK